MIKSDPFIDDWDWDDYKVLVRCLKNTPATGGLVYGAFADGELKGFASVESTLMGSRLPSHSAVESQAFYRAMGCVEAEEYISEHVEQEPYDCQPECPVQP